MVTNLGRRKKFSLEFIAGRKKTHAYIGIFRRKKHERNNNNSVRGILRLDVIMDKEQLQIIM